MLHFPVCLYHRNFESSTFSSQRYDEVKRFQAFFVSLISHELSDEVSVFSSKTCTLCTIIYQQQPKMKWKQWRERWRAFDERKFSIRLFVSYPNILEILVVFALIQRHSNEKGKKTKPLRNLIIQLVHVYINYSEYHNGI